MKNKPNMTYADYRKEMDALNEAIERTNTVEKVSATERAEMDKQINEIITEAKAQRSENID